MVFPITAKKQNGPLPSKLALVSFILLIIQITYGGMTAGLKAGHVSDTWPLMFGKLIPPNLFSSLINIFETPQTIVFIHRWFAFAVFISIIALYFAARKESHSIEIKNGLNWLLGLVVFQIILGNIDSGLPCANRDRSCASGWCAGAVRTDDLFHSSSEGNGCN